MQATINNTTIAESNNTVEIEGSHYFPPGDVKKQLLAESETPYTCPWKGDAQYFHVSTDEQTFEDAAWSYPNPKDSAIDKVGTDFSDYVAFDISQVDVS
jgi:uncharacterized protein (DUF427 family)